MRCLRPSPSILATASLVLSYRMLWGMPPRKATAETVAVQKGLGGLRRIGLHEATVAVGQVQHEVMHLALHTGDHRHRLPEITLGLPRGMGQRHEHLLRPPPALPHLVLDYGVLTVEPVLVPQPFKDPLGRVALLPGDLSVSFQDGVNHPGAGRILSLSKGWAGGVGPGAGNLAAPTRPASCAPCPGAGQTPGRLPERSSLPPYRPGERARTFPLQTSIAPSKD